MVICRKNIIVEPMPDELYLSHEYRQQVAIGAKNRKEHYGVLLRKYGASITPRRRLNAMELLAASCGITHQSYAAKHTMLPALRVTENELSDSATAKMGWLSQTFHHAATLPSVEPRICPTCIEQDCKRNHFSWFHRIHHLSAISVCPEHGSVLWRILSDKPFNRLPHQWHDLRLTEQLVETRVANQDITWYSRYVRVFIGLLARDVPVPSKRLNILLSSIAFSRGFRTKVGGSEPLISSCLRDLAGHDYSNHYIRSIRNYRSGTWVPAIDGIGSTRNFSRPGYLYAMILAVLFDSVTDALETVNLCGTKWR